MEYKFKTVYKSQLHPEQLVFCEINLENEIYIKLNGKKQIIGTSKEQYGSLFPILPIFQYTGKKDIEGEEIYRGNLLQFTCDCALLSEVRWDEDSARFYLEPISANINCCVCEKKLNNHGISISDTYLKIVGHSALKGEIA